MAIRHDYTTPQHERDYTAVLLSCTVTTVCAATSVLLLLAAAAAICAVAAAAVVVVVVVVAVVSGRLGTCRGCDPGLPMPIPYVELGGRVGRSKQEYRTAEPPVTRRERSESSLRTFFALSSQS